jgi:hypothetical protein
MLICFPSKLGVAKNALSRHKIFRFAAHFAGWQTMAVHRLE